MTAPVIIFLPTHLKQNEPYLKAALRGIFWQKTTFPFHVYLVSSAESPPDVGPRENLTIIHDPKLDNASRKLNHLMDHVVKDYECILLHSDDVVLGGGALENLVQTGRQSNVIQNPFCNGDIPAKYVAPFYLYDIDRRPIHVHTTLSLEDLTPHFHSLQYPPERERILVPFQWVSFYCTLIFKQTFDLVGRLDERLDHKGNDFDFCLRASAFQIGSIVNFSAMCVHFGSKTLSVTKTKAMEDEADSILYEKWKV